MNGLLEMATKNGYINPTWLTENFMEQALREGEHDPEISVKHIDIRAATTFGDNYCSLMYRVAARFDRGNGNYEECSLIVKDLPFEEKQRKVFTETNVFTREIEMYKYILPTLHNFLYKLNPESFKPIGPKGLYFTEKPEQRLVIEDLKLDGFKVATRQYGLNLHKCKLVMTLIGKFHATSIILKSQYPDSIKYFLTNMWADIQTEESPSVKLFSTSLELLANEVETWPKCFKKYVEKLRKLSKTVYDQTNQVVLRDENGFNVLNHGDLWINNIMFKYPHDFEDACELRLVDFQAPYYGSPAIDLIYFLYTSPTPAVRLHHFKELLVVYHDSLKSTLKALQYSGKIISFDELNNELERKSFYCIFSACIIMATADNTPSLENINETSTSSLYFSEVYKTEMKRLLPIFDEKGLLG